MTLPQTEAATAASSQAQPTPPTANGSNASAAPLILVEATHAQHLAVRAAIFRDHERWRRGRSEQDYWIAEETMTGAKLAERRAWVLVPEDDRETTDYRCTCLTFRFEGLVTTTTSPPSVQSAPIYLIGGVFTPSPHRGSGHGGVMMRLLHEKLRPLTPNLLRTMSPAAAATAASPVSPRKDGSQYGNDAVCSVLWSDLETWYERNGGYKLKGWSDTVVSAVPAGTGEVESSDDEDVDYLSPEELPQRFAQLAKEDERLIREELEELATTTTTASSSSSSPNPIISLISNRGESWRYSSLQSQLQVRFQSRPMPTSWGCQLKSSPTTWAIWAYGLLPPSSGEASSLNVLRHRAENAESFYQLLQAARRAASRVEGCSRVVVWNVEDNSSPSSSFWPEVKARLEKEAGAKVWNEVRPTSRPAVAWYRDADEEGNDGVVRAEDAEPVHWINAEFGYCLAT